MLKIDAVSIRIRRVPSRVGPGLGPGLGPGWGPGLGPAWARLGPKTVRNGFKRFLIVSGGRSDGRTDGGRAGAKETRAHGNLNL